MKRSPRVHKADGGHAAGKSREPDAAATATQATTHERLIGPIRLAGRVLHLLAIVLLPLAPLLFLRMLGKQRTLRLARWWYGRLLHALHVRVYLHGTPPSRAILIAANHCSWLDILVLGHHFDAVFISKSEISHWPLVGHYARLIGTLFLARGTYDTEVVIQHTHATITEGHSVILFPQGTTASALCPQRFYARLFAAAVDHGEPILPVAVRYSDARTPPGTHHPLVPWVGTSLSANFLNVLRLRQLRVDVGVCPMIESGGYSRRSLAEAGRQAINARLQSLQNDVSGPIME